MKRVISILTALVLLVALAVPAFAADMVDSIAAKDAPKIIPVENKNGDEVLAVLLKDYKNEVDSLTGIHLRVTPVVKAQPDMELTALYKGLEDNTIQLPKKGLVVRDLFQVDVVNDKNEILEMDDISVQVKFYLGIDSVTAVEAYTYENDGWEAAHSLVNNGDGTVTVIFDHFCPVAFMTAGSTTPPSQTGDPVGNSMGIWIAVLAVSAAAVVTLVVIARRKTSK